MRRGLLTEMYHVECQNIIAILRDKSQKIKCSHVNLNDPLGTGVGVHKNVPDTKVLNPIKKPLPCYGSVHKTVTQNEHCRGGLAKKEEVWKVCSFQTSSLK